MKRWTLLLLAISGCAASHGVEQRTAEPVTQAAVRPISANEDPIAALDRELSPVIRRAFPDAKIEVTSKAYRATSKTKQHTIRGRNRLGELNPKSHVQEGPTRKGFMIEIEAWERSYNFATIIPQEFDNGYWKTYVDARGVAEWKGETHIKFSYGDRMNQASKTEVLDLLRTLLPESRGNWPASRRASAR